MKRHPFSLRSSLALHRARAIAAGYRIVGRSASAGALPMARLGSTASPFWPPTLLDSLRAPLTRQRE
jgi:hypothetical protein